MVKRQSELTSPGQGKLAVVDLDGTYLRGNSLHILIRCAFAQALRAGHLSRACRMAFYAGLRLLRLSSHAKMKFAMLRVIPLSPTLCQKFAAKARANINPEVATDLDRLRQSGYHILLATAAADSYVPLIWDGDYVATPMSNNPDYHECRGELKLKAVKQYATTHKLRISIIFTDHRDDLALLARANAERVVLVNPSASTIVACQMASIRNLEIRKS